MRSYLIFILFFVSTSLFLKAQIVTIQFDKNMTAYYGIENFITIGIENSSCDSIFITAQKGQIKKLVKVKCKFTYKPDEFGNDTIRFYKISKNIDTLKIDEKVIKILSIPFVGEFQNAFNDNEINKDKLKLFPQSFYVFSLNMNIDLKVPIDSFYVVVKRNCNLTFKKFYLINDDFSDLLNEFSLLESGDEVIFGPIYYTFNGFVMSDDKMRLTIK